ncbi:hypothetical protein V9T40_014299 [Parthenolecanium corni]|uniref:PH domain-containing protein n=1 Tax=Parthenolecanium corni TaxID=536013 RepID=A0AAN9XWW4_9HEMI
MSRGMNENLTTTFAGESYKLTEYDLEQKIELEIKMREGTTKLLAACKHQTQALEAAKNLLISNERMNAYMTELQRRKREISINNTNTNISKGRLSLSDIRIPLIWRDTDHFKNKGDYRRFAVFCLVKVGAEMYDTSLLSPVDRSQTDLTFTDSLVFNKISSDFKLKVEVYSHMLQDDLSIASAPRRIKNTIHTSISRTVGKKLAASLRDELNAGKIGPNFELMASASLCLDDTNDNIRTHDLKIENTGNGRHQLPLFGHFCCRLAAQPNCMTQETYSAFTYVPDAFVKGSCAKDKKSWTKCWTQLVAFKLKFWIKHEHFLENREPDTCMSINKNTVINLKKSSPVDIEISSDHKDNNLILRVESSEERAKWYKYLAQHIADSQRWKQSADTFMAIQLNEPNRHSYVPTRHGSLYDQTPIIGFNVENEEMKDPKKVLSYMAGNSSNSSSSSSASSSPPFRERSSSSSSFNKPRVSRLSAWPFSRNH